MMKTGKLLFFIASGILSTASCVNIAKKTDEVKANVNPSLSLLWKTDTVFTGSESSLYDEITDRIFISNGNTKSSAKDNDGFISTMNADGSIRELKWISSGLHAPKGMVLLDGKLYVSDIDEIKIIDTANIAIEKVIPIEGSIFLNDVATDGELVYVSDTRAGTIYSYSPLDEHYEMIVDNSPNANGLECHKGYLYVLDGEGLKRLSNDGKYAQEILHPEMTGGDGLVILNDSTFIASRWHGEVFYIKGKEMISLLDTREEKSNTADIGFIKGKNVLLVPTFLKNEVAAYQFIH